MSRLPRKIVPDPFQQLWSEAYKSSHVCVDITDKIFDYEGRFQKSAGTNAENIAWLREEAANLLDLAKDLKRLERRASARLVESCK